MRNARLNSIARVVFCAFLLGGTFHGQDTDWERSQDAGDAAMASRDYARAETSYREALASAEKRLKKDARISALLWKLAGSCNAQGKHEEAESLAKRSSVSMDEALNAHKPKNASDEYMQVNVSTALFDKLGDLFAENQRYQDAENMYEKSLKGWQEYVVKPAPTKPDNEDFYRFVIRNQDNTPEKFVAAAVKLATLYQKEGKSKEAIALYRELGKTVEKLYEQNDTRLAPSLTNIAVSQFRLGDYEGAEPLFKQVVDILGSSKYKDSPDMAKALENYAALLKKTGREDAAKPFLDRAGVIRGSSAAVPH
jgi:tetratricopeptide (TPR) repeat protein